MIFDFITITGADDKVDPIFLAEILDQYYHVEWGILFSDKRQGSPRYPSPEWIAKLVDNFYLKWDSSFSAHLCGSMCEHIIRNIDVKFLDEHVGPLFPRLQLNSFPEFSDIPESGVSEISMNPFLYDDGGNLFNVNQYVAALASALWSDGDEIVLPIPNERVAEACRNFRFSKNISFLYDSSRGLGISPDGWPEVALPDDAYVGFAGGINPDNIREVLETLCARPGDRHFWLDLESGARTDDQFDQKKVEQILKISEEFL